MKSHIAGGGGKAAAIAKTHVVALYERGSGRIRHLHTVTVLEGGRDVSREDATKEALERAARAGHDAGALGVATSGDPSHARGPHRVDVHKGTFVPAPTAQRRRPDGKKH